MFKREEEKQLYFSTKTPLKINKMVYRPSICYSVPSLARKSLQKNKNVTFYTEPVRFVNGSMISKKVEKAAPAASIVQTVETVKAPKKRKK